MNDDEKYCINCNHCKIVYLDKEKITAKHCCDNFRDLVTGDPRQCLELRSPFGLCGEHARFFAPKKKRRGEK